MAPGFKPVAWVAAVAGAALGCYMLSLNVASERAELARIEADILRAKQEIRALQTELGTRGRLAQLEQWNAEVLALSAPASGQFLDSEVKLARFDQRAPTIEERAKVQMASAQTEPVADKVRAPVVQATAPLPGALGTQPLVRRASLELPAPALATKPVGETGPAEIEKPADAGQAKATRGIDETLAREIRAAARAEAASGER